MHFFLQLLPQVCLDLQALCPSPLGPRGLCRRCMTGPQAHNVPVTQREEAGQRHRPPPILSPPTLAKCTALHNVALHRITLHRVSSWHFGLPDTVNDDKMTLTGGFLICTVLLCTLLLLIKLLQYIYKSGLIGYNICSGYNEEYE